MGPHPCHPGRWWPFLQPTSASEMVLPATFHFLTVTPSIADAIVPQVLQACLDPTPCPCPEFSFGNEQLLWSPGIPAEMQAPKEFQERHPMCGVADSPFQPSPYPGSQP